MPVTPGSQLGGYTVRELIGAGGMGEVYLGHDARLNRSVALKILPESFAQDADHLARFKREAQVPASLNHPNIGSRARRSFWNVFNSRYACVPSRDGKRFLINMLLEVDDAPINVVQNWRSASQ